MLTLRKRSVSLVGRKILITLNFSLPKAESSSQHFVSTLDGGSEDSITAVVADLLLVLSLVRFIKTGQLHYTLYSYTYLYPLHTSVRKTVRRTNTIQYSVFFFFLIMQYFMMNFFIFCISVNSNYSRVSF